MEAYDYQVRGAEQAYDILRRYGMVYIAWEERCGKTLTSILTVEQSKAKRCLVVTKKKALSGWVETLIAYKPEKLFTVINYHGLYTQHKEMRKIKGKMEQVTVQTLKPEFKDKFDVVILDEAHAYLSAYPKTGAIANIVQEVCYQLPVILLSATPAAQGYQLLFHQLNMSKYSPFDSFKDFYKFFNVYGIPEYVYTQKGKQITYNNVKSTVWERVKHLFLTMTRKELNFEHEPEDVLHYIELDSNTKRLYNECIVDEMLILGELEIPLDSSMKLRTTLHMLEGGVFKHEDNYGILGNTEKIDAIKRDFGDETTNTIMYHYKAELSKLSQAFKRTQLLQATSFAEGVDLSGQANLIIYSQDFSTAKHSQRRARQANRNRATEIKVHFYLVKGGLSEQVYKTVSLNKQNFVDKVFERKTL